MEEETMSLVSLDEAVVEIFLKYARLVVARGYVHNSLGNIAIRVPHPDFPHGVAYTKHAEISLEEMTGDNVVITDIPTPKLLHGTVPTSVGHNLNREILRLRPDIGAVIHVHHDETIALFASGAVKELRVLSLEFPYVMARPPHLVPSHLDVEQDVGPVAGFIQGTNSVIMENHGVTTLGRTISEAYHRLNTLTSEVRRTALAERLAAARTEVHYIAPDAVDWMYRHAESVIYPSRDTTRRPAGGERRA
jgi:ribulose-5-phosphate 4-epimerase/fuculose-1-phosphate aldolase